MKRRRRIVLAVCVVAAAGVWLCFNRPGRFGYHRFALTVYSGIPFPAVDVVVRASGFPGIRTGKAHWLSVEEYERLIGRKAAAGPEVVVVGTGYEEFLKVDSKVLDRGGGPAVEALPTPQAIKRFNELRSSGKRVACIIHSTC